MIAHYLIELFIVGVDILILWEKSYVVEGMNVDSTHTYMLSLIGVASGNTSQF